jgi:hypothetical protein
LQRQANAPSFLAVRKLGKSENIPAINVRAGSVAQLLKHLLSKHKPSIQIPVPLKRTTRKLNLIRYEKSTVAKDDKQD